ncbi:hypothetical protein MCOR18_004960 [Pyricularia oryzae]|nr:hypothetical protein MCOR18_004960 [Pyricularia oryzae]KAI6592756.1 hypothetical protein MCOR06_004070 [Pyricularia oryzae]
MYDNNTPNQDDYMDQQYFESQEMARDLSLGSFGSAVSGQSAVLSCPTPDTMFSNQDLLQGDLGQQLQQAPGAMSFDQTQLAFNQDQTVQYMGYQGHGDTGWVANSVAYGLVGYPGTLDYGVELYNQHGAAPWNPIQSVVEAHWPQQSPYHAVPNSEPDPAFTMDDTWLEEPANEPSVQTVQPTTPAKGQSSTKQQFRCPHEGCNSVFDRHANLTRHMAKSKKHALAEGSAGKPETYNCGFRTCQRAGRDAIPRKDHCREHLRNFHKQDLYKRGEKVEISWLQECLIDKSYWYCNKCLARNSTVGVSSPWSCQRCGTNCEPERVNIRLQLEDQKLATGPRDLSPAECEFSK